MNAHYETLTAAELGKGINEGTYDPEEVMEHFIARIKRLNPAVNAFTYTKFDYAREQAKQLKKRLSSGECCGPFAGVPFGLKDFLPSKTGWTASHGGVPSRITVDDVDSEFCKAMESLGGIAVGKTNAPAYGFSGCCDNLLYGPTKNPFDLSLNSGGSSGGSAAAVASGMLLISEGGDAGGSIRIPSAWNNLFGFKASAGAIPSVIRPDSYAATHPYCCNGGLTKSVEDTAILLNAMVKYDRRDPTSVPFPHDDFLVEMKRSINGLRIAYTPDFGCFPVEEEIVKKTKEVAMMLQSLGAIVEEVPFSLKRTPKEYFDIWRYAMSFDSAIEFELLKKQGMDFLSDHADEVGNGFAESVRDVYSIGMKELYDFNLARTELLDSFEDVFDRYDAILSPVSLCMPAVNSPTRGKTTGPNSINGQSIDPVCGFATTYLVNFIGYPAASVPAGLSKDALPIGLQVIAPKFQDGRVLSIAEKIEKLLPWRNLYPTL